MHCTLHDKEMIHTYIQFLFSTFCIYLNSLDAFNTQTALDEQHLKSNVVNHTDLFFCTCSVVYCIVCTVYLSSMLCYVALVSLGSTRVLSNVTMYCISYIWLKLQYYLLGLPFFETSL